jgi:type II secretory pathway predicted ATPase ExeA
MTKLSSSDEGRPLLSAPKATRYFAAAASEEARQRLARSIARHEGPALLVGAAGLGKSMLLAVLAEQFAGKMAVVTLPGAQLCTRRALLQVILFELGLPYRDMDEGELRLSIVGYLRGVGRTRASKEHAHADEGMALKPRRLLLLVDEADSLPLRLLEELRALTNIAVGGVPLVSLVLAGSPTLEERFADPQLDGFSQRVAARCYLAALGRDETLQYVRAQVAAAGMKPDGLFEPAALEAMYSATGGVPRLVNQLGDQAAWIAQETGCQPLDAALVQQAWGELQQLPAPWNTEGHAAATATSATAEMVEFGELDGAFADDMNHRGPRASLPARPGGSGGGGSRGGGEEADDELPASIPIGRALEQRDGKNLSEFDAAIDDTQELLDSYDDHLETSELDAGGGAAGRPPALNPFDESFGDEDVLVDRYRDFELQMLRRAPQVRNRMDPDFADVLGGATGEYGVRRLQPGVEIVPSAPARAAQGEASPPAVKLSIARPAPAARSGESEEVLIVEDRDRGARTVTPGRQFKRLFSRLESSAAAQ